MVHSALYSSQGPNSLQYWCIFRVVSSQRFTRSAQAAIEAGSLPSKSVPLLPHTSSEAFFAGRHEARNSAERQRLYLRTTWSSHRTRRSSEYWALSGSHFSCTSAVHACLSPSGSVSQLCAS